MKDFKNFTPEEAVGMVIDSYGGKSEEELISKIFSIAKEKRKSGQLSDGEIDAFYNSFLGSLNDVQKKKCLKLIQKLKKIPMQNG